MKAVFYIFVPHHFLPTRTIKQLYISYKEYENYVLINCIHAVPVSLKYLSERSNRIHDLSRFKVGRIGLLFPYDWLKNREIRESSPCHDLHFNLVVNCIENEIGIDNFTYNRTSVSAERIHIVIYDGSSLVASELLYREAVLIGNDVFKGSFIQFLVDTVNFSLEKDSLLDIECHKNELISKKAIGFCASEQCYDCENSMKTKFLSNICSLIWLFGICFQFACLWWPSFVKSLLVRTGLGRQLHKRFFLLYNVFEQLQKRNALSIRSFNIILSLVLDLIAGWLAFYFLKNLLADVSLLQNVVDTTNDLVNWLEKLIRWLMGVPAGLKLNIPLNNALGEFFLYHIYLWKNHIGSVIPLFKILLRTLMMIGLLGLTYIPSVLNDLISLVTIHIYCFYSYASRIYSYQLMSLLALWRVFRGKKWNPETQRVETFTYAVHHLYIGTLLFTVLFFLLPTVMVYYFVFAALYMVVLLVQGFITGLIHILSVFPIYAFLLRIVHSPKTAGGIFFSVLKTKPNLMLSMEVIQLDIISVVKMTYPLSDQIQPSMSLKSLVTCLLFGETIYPF